MKPFTLSNTNIAISPTSTHKYRLYNQNHKLIAHLPHPPLFYINPLSPKTIYSNPQIKLPFFCWILKWLKWFISRIWLDEIFVFLWVFRRCTLIWPGSCVLLTHRWLDADKRHTKQHLLKCNTIIRLIDAIETN